MVHTQSGIVVLSHAGLTGKLPIVNTLLMAHLSIMEQFIKTYPTFVLSNNRMLV